MRVLVAEDQEIVRSALRRFLGEMPDVTLVSEVVSAASLIAQAREALPDLVVLDWELGGSSSAEPAGHRLSTSQARRQLLSLLHALPSHPQIIALSGRPELRQSALDAGADGFVSKADSPERLMMTLHAVCRGRDGDPSEEPCHAEDKHDNLP